MPRILVTGANGFVGNALCRRLIADGHSVIASVRSSESAGNLPSGVAVTVTQRLSPETDWSRALSGVDVVVHLAARVHVMHESAGNPLSEFRHVNVEGTRRLAQSALSCGVKRFIFLSTIGVNGNVTSPKKPFTESDEPAPHNDYSRSKLEAEQMLRSMAGAGSRMELVILRAPLVYGPSNPGNALLLFHAVERRRPLPLASVRNHRSLIYLGNLVDAITLCCTHPRASGQTYLVSDHEDVSTPELIRRIAAAFGAPARLFPFPPALMSLAAALLGKRAAAQRLLGSLTVDSSRIARDLAWRPPFTVQQGLSATAQWFLQQKGRI
jgi:UDP-N-acetyl-alpha-D-quinovosamine dehydrogenase